MAVDRSRRRRLQAVPEPNVGKGLKGAERGSGEDVRMESGDEDLIYGEIRKRSERDNDSLLVCY